MKILIIIVAIIITLVQCNAETTTNENVWSISILTNADSLANISGARIYGDLLKQYAEIDELNGWIHRDKYVSQRPYLKKRQDFIDEMIYESELYLIGKVLVINGINSELIMTINRDIKRIYLLNYSNTTIISVVKIYELYSDDYGNYECKLIEIGERTYRYVKKDGNDDIIIEDEKDKKLNEYSILCKFQIDDFGNLIYL